MNAMKRVIISDSTIRSLKNLLSAIELLDKFIDVDADSVTLTADLTEAAHAVFFALLNKGATIQDVGYAYDWIHRTLDTASDEPAIAIHEFNPENGKTPTYAGKEYLIRIDYYEWGIATWNGERFLSTSALATGVKGVTEFALLPNSVIL